MDWDNSTELTPLSQRHLIKLEIKSFLNPDITENISEYVFEILDQECQVYRSCDLCSLPPDDFCQFITERFTVRSYYLSCLLQKISSGQVVNLQQITPLFGDFNLNTETVIRNFLRSESCQKTQDLEVFFRAGKFTCINDDMGRSKNSILKKKIFDPADINQKKKAHGVGLYTTRDITAAKSYLHKSYNTAYPVSISAIFIKPGVNILSLQSNSAFSRFLRQHHPTFEEEIKSDIRNDRCYLENCLYIMSSSDTKCGYTLIKSPEIVAKVSPYDPTMLTKIHIPFSSQEINSYKMQPKLMASLVHSEYIKDDFVQVEPDSAKLLLPIFRYVTAHKKETLRLEIEFHHKQSSEAHPGKKYKFFTTINGQNYKIRPSARRYETSRDFSSPEFHVQYKLP